MNKQWSWSGSKPTNQSVIYHIVYNGHHLLITQIKFSSFYRKLKSVC